MALEPQPTGKTDKVPNNLIFEEAKDKITKLVAVMDEQEQCVLNNRNLRYTNLDIEAERKAGRIAPDELYVPQHVIDTNIRREQARYVSYLTGARRAMVLRDADDPSVDTAMLETDITNKFRYDGWQIPMFRWIDGMQQNGYGILELTMDATKPGHLKYQEVAYGDFGYSLDTRDIQSCEMVVRRYYFTKTQLLAMTRSDTWKFDLVQTKKVFYIQDTGVNDYKEQSLYKIEKVMFRKSGVVYVGWSCQLKCDDWLREPKPLYLGRQTMDPTTGVYVKAFETAYPYYCANYNISENTVLKQGKGRAYLDQDTQEGISSLMSSFVTAHRRAAGLYFSKDSENDPNADVLEQVNVFFKQGALINGKVKQFQLQAPDSTMLQAIQGLAGMNMQETSSINFTAMNRQDSRKTASEIQAAQTEAQLLSTIQLALFSVTMKDVCTTFFEIVRSRVMAGLIRIQSPQVAQLYLGNYIVKPSGDTDVIEKQEKIVKMQQTWPIVAQTPVAPMFLQKLLTLLFPDDAPLYIQGLQTDGQLKGALMACMNIIQALVEEPQQLLTPQAQQHLPELKQILMQVTGILNPQMGRQIGKMVQHRQVKQVVDEGDPRHQLDNQQQQVTQPM